MPPSDAPRKYRDSARLAQDDTPDALLELAKAGTWGLIASIPGIGPILREIIDLPWTDIRWQRTDDVINRHADEIDAISQRLDGMLTRQDLERLLVGIANSVPGVVERTLAGHNDLALDSYLGPVATIDREPTNWRRRARDHCYFVPSGDLPGWDRFYSIDRRFPISFLFPRGIDPFFDFNRSNWLFVDFNNDWGVLREDLLEPVLGRASPTSQRLLTPEETVAFQVERAVVALRILEPALLGRRREVAPRYEWVDPQTTQRREDVICGDRSGALWHFRNDDGLDDEFERLLGSVEWLGPPYFAAVEARLAEEGHKLL